MDGFRIPHKAEAVRSDQYPRYKKSYDIGLAQLLEKKDDKSPENVNDDQVFEKVGLFHGSFILAEEMRFYDPAVGEISHLSAERDAGSAHTAARSCYESHTAKTSKFWRINYEINKFFADKYG